MNSREWQKLLLRPDVARCLKFSKLRCLISIISIVLLATDIPRSGLGVRHLNQFYSTNTMPATAIRFGPYDYPVRHIRREGEEFRGREGEDPVDSANVWSYKYDTTSLGMRGAVELLNIPMYPDFLLYKGRLGLKNDHGAVLALNTTFLMLDSFISTVRARLLPTNTSGWTVFRFATKHNWVDRVHHYLIQFIKQNTIWSLHSLHIAHVPKGAKSLRVCTASTMEQPRFCTYQGIWHCENPLNSSLPPVRLSQQMDLRFQGLQRQYPELELEVTLLSTHRPSMTSGTLSYTFFNFEEHEIVMLTRGRRCLKDFCLTVFVDDYRYERSILQTNVEDWYFFIATVRAGAQGYFWLRLVLLYHTAFVSTKTFGGLWHSRVVSAITTVFKIPFQVIVYSSLVPVVGYVVALMLDGNFMDIYLDSYWSTLKGTSNFDLLSFLKSAVTQMRTVWLMALLVDLMVLVTRKPIHGSEEKIPGIRGLAISFTSALTIIGPYRQTALRSAAIVQTMTLPGVGQRMDTVQSVPQWFFNESTYMFDDSMTMLGFCMAVVAALASVARVMSFCRRSDRGLVLMSTLNVPYGTEFLWPTSSLSVRFNALTSPTPYRSDLPIRPSVMRISPEPQYLPASAPRASYFNTTKIARVDFGPTQLPSGGLCSRTIESHSILQLMNIAMMSDPWNFLWLRVLGVPLYIYRIRSSRSVAEDVDNSSGLFSYAVILPYTEEEMEERTGLSSNDFQLLEYANSRDLQLEILLQSG